MPKVNTYLSFNGSTAEAMRVYEGALGAKLDVLFKFGDMPDAKQIPPGSAHKVMHAQLSFKDDGVLMASDCVGGLPYDGMKGFRLRSAMNQWTKLSACSMRLPMAAK
jgi:PhnB protein